MAFRESPFVVKPEASSDSTLSAFKPILASEIFSFNTIMNLLHLEPMTSILGSFQLLQCCESLLMILELPGAIGVSDDVKEIAAKTKLRSRKKTQAFVEKSSMKLTKYLQPPRLSVFAGEP